METNDKKHYPIYDSIQIKLPDGWILLIWKDVKSLQEAQIATLL